MLAGEKEAEEKEMSEGAERGQSEGLALIHTSVTKKLNGIFFSFGENFMAVTL